MEAARHGKLFVRASSEDGRSYRRAARSRTRVVVGQSFILSYQSPQFACLDRDMLDEHVTDRQILVVMINVVLLENVRQDMAFRFHWLSGSTRETALIRIVTK